jgi:putative ABC transport system substrate-binding protein
MRRRAFITVVIGAAAWPLGAPAQQTPPVIGFLGATTPTHYAARLGSFREGLKEAGYVEGRNLAIEYRWAEFDYSRLPVLAAELVARHIAVMVAGGGTASALAAKAATATIPIVFASAADPVALGLVASLSHPGGNVTGVSNQNSAIGSKDLEIVHELLPKATAVAVLVNPTNPLSEQFLHDVQPTARALGVELHILQASTRREIEAAFQRVAELRANALVISPDLLFYSETERIAARALSQALPAVSRYRPFVAAGGLASYGTSESEYYRAVGALTGKILNGANPADLPVEQSTKVELIINLKTAKALGINVPVTLTGRADEVIE